MRPDAFSAMRDTLEYGPGHCPPDLFAGEVIAIVRGLKVHANQIAHARHVAMEESYPRLREAMGAEAFHSAAAAHLSLAATVSRSLDTIGAEFAPRLAEPALRDLARVEWAALEAYHSADAEALTMADIAVLAPEELLDLEVAMHPAARAIALEDEAAETWDGDGSQLLVTRPATEVMARRIADGPPNLPAAVGAIFEAGVAPAALFALVAAGALMVQKGKA